MDVVDAVVPAQERRPLRIDDPGDIRRGIGVAEQRDRRQGWTISPNELGLMMRMERMREIMRSSRGAA